MESLENMFSKKYFYIPRAVKPAVFAMVMLVAASPAEAGSCNSAKAYISKVANSVTRIVANTSVGSAVREQRFRQVFRSNMNIRKLGKFALGRYARKMPASKNATYLKLVEGLVIKVFFSRMKDYRGEKFKIYDTRKGCRAKGSRGREFIVSGEIKTASGRRVAQISWWVVGSRIFDISVEGVWLAQQQRSAFGSVLRKSNGDFEALFKNLRTRISRGR